MRVDAGGYSFRPPSGYTWEVYETNAQVAPPDADAQLGPVIVLSGGQNAVDLFAGATTVEGAFAIAQDSLGQSGVTLSAPDAISVGGRPALSGSLSGVEGGTPMAGRVVTCLPAPGQAFILISTSPQTAWDDGVGLAVDALVGTIEFSPRLSPSGNPGAWPPGSGRRQRGSTR